MLPWVGRLFYSPGKHPEDGFLCDGKITSPSLSTQVWQENQLPGCGIAIHPKPNVWPIVKAKQWVCPITALRCPHNGPGVLHAAPHASAPCVFSPPEF